MRFYFWKQGKLQWMSAQWKFCAWKFTELSVNFNLQFMNQIFRLTENKRLSQKNITWISKFSSVTMLRFRKKVSNFLMQKYVVTFHILSYIKISKFLKTYLKIGMGSSCNCFKFHFISFPFLFIFSKIGLLLVLIYDRDI